MLRRHNSNVIQLSLFVWQIVRCLRQKNFHGNAVAESGVYVRLISAVSPVDWNLCIKHTSCCLAWVSNSPEITRWYIGLKWGILLGEWVSPVLILVSKSFKYSKQGNSQRRNVILSAGNQLFYKWDWISSKRIIQLWHIHKQAMVTLIILNYKLTMLLGCILSQVCVINFIVRPASNRISLSMQLHMSSYCSHPQMFDTISVSLSVCWPTFYARTSKR